MKCLEKAINIRQEKGEMAAAKQLYYDFVRNCPLILARQIVKDLPKDHQPGH